MVCGVCLRGKLKSFIISNVTSFVRGSIHQGDSRFSDISKGKQHAFIHLIPKWRPINYSFACMLISPLRLVYMYRKQKNFEVKMRRRGLFNMQTKE